MARAPGCELAAHELDLVCRPLAERSLRHTCRRLSQRFRFRAFDAFDPGESHVASKPFTRLFRRELPCRDLDGLLQPGQLVRLLIDPDPGNPRKAQVWEEADSLGAQTQRREPLACGAKDVSQRPNPWRVHFPQEP